jgi:exodeoxyribonuclease-1
MNGGMTFYWHDYETFGIDSCRDRPSQFAGQRTTYDLEPIGEPLAIYCKPPRDVLPTPFSCLITGITPQQAERDGFVEAEFAGYVHEELAAPETCGVGFNSIRFDDEFTRNLLYRNFYDPYAREWDNGNSRWDIIDLVRMCHALRPDGIEWPRRDDGTASFRLEDLSFANRLDHGRAHDALSDVFATIGVARLVKTRQPRLFDWFFALRRKQNAFELLDWVQRTPVLHVSSRYPAERGCTAMVVPLAPHPDQTNKVIVYDLDADPRSLLELDPDEIADRVFTPRADLPDGVERIPLKAVSANRSPALAPVSTLAGVDMARIRLDRERCLAHYEMLRDVPGLDRKVQIVFASSSAREGPSDPDLALYRGFLDDFDRMLLQDVRGTPPDQLATRRFDFRDERCHELLFRYRARNFPETLSPREAAHWEQFRRIKLTTQTEATTLTLDAYFREIALLRSSADGPQSAILDALEDWGHRLGQGIPWQTPPISMPPG